MRKTLGKFVMPILAVCLLIFAIIHVVRAQQTLPKPPPPVDPARNPFGKTVAGAGIVEARNENVSIGTALPGLALKVYVPVEKVGTKVKKGDPLFLVDTRQLEAQLVAAEANLLSAQAQLTKLDRQPRKEELDLSKAKREVARANVQLQKDLADRSAKLIGTRSVTEEEYRQRILGTLVADKQFDQAEADYQLTKAGAWDYDKKIAEAAVKMAEAQVKQIKTDIERALVRAPKDGVVLQVNVREGEYVGTPPNQALVVLGDVHKIVHVRVDVDEHDIPRFKKGAPARASLRGNPQVSYPLTYVRVEPYVIPKKSLTGDNTERVDTRVLQVIYALDVSDKPIYVGQQMDVFIDVEAATAPPESQGD